MFHRIGVQFIPHASTASARLYCRIDRGARAYDENVLQSCINVHRPRCHAGVAAMDAIDAMRADAARVVAAMERTDAARGVVEAMEQIDAAAKMVTAMDAIDAAWSRFEVDVQMEAA